MQIAVQNVDNAVLTRLYVVLAAESLDASDPLHGFFVQRYDTARHHITRLLRHGTTTGELRPISTSSNSARRSWRCSWASSSSG